MKYFAHNENCDNVCTVVSDEVNYQNEELHKLISQIKRTKEGTYFIEVILIIFLISIFQNG